MNARKDLGTPTMGGDMVGALRRRGRESVVPAAAPAVPEPYEGPETGALDASERADLQVCEQALDALRRAFWAAGKALDVIQKARLYREDYPSFEEYLAARWDMQTSHAYRLIQAWPLAERLFSTSPIGDKINEAQVRELLPVAAEHGQDVAELVYATVAETDGVRVTAALLRDVVHALPGGQLDRRAAVDQIRAFLAGQVPPPESAPVPPVKFWQTEARRARTAIGRLRQHTDAIAAADPDDARALAGELRAMAEEVEKRVKGKGARRA